MKTYLLAVSGAIIISAVISCIVSDGKMGKFIKGMSRLFVFSVLLVPLLSVFSGKGLNLSASEIQDDEKYLEYCADFLEEKDEEAIAHLILEEYPLEIGITVEREPKGGFPLKKITLKIFDSGLSENGEHINIQSRIQELLESKYGCQTEVVWQERE